jgi:hypothetical protein
MWVQQRSVAEGGRMMVGDALRYTCGPRESEGAIESELNQRGRGRERGGGSHLGEGMVPAVQPNSQ